MVQQGSEMGLNPAGQQDLLPDLNLRLPPSSSPEELAFWYMYIHDIARANTLWNGRHEVFSLSILGIPQALPFLFRSSLKASR